MVPAVPLQGGAVAVFSLLFALLMFVAHIAMIVWTYNDAQKRSDHPPILWAIVVFLAPLLGIVLYLIIGRDGGY
ncbi:PLDc N-terminal domain-containing protein [Halorubrum halodurans]|uniref:Cardiolipin synthase N-terminal domain-containing protein n=1 Tax=Halorubrum halodurans TaxID=1383851 RepID=A0A256IL25_9EURY|nr:PLDc N-terminal domain-containing protein [Halorubrum halodurans]OYR57006.1 hypothetical protein DJ70_06980 [Halorubrum halodurans]